MARSFCRATLSGILLSLTAVIATPAIGQQAWSLYEEPLRPRYHFTADEGYIND